MIIFQTLVAIKTEGKCGVGAVGYNNEFLARSMTDDADPSFLVVDDDAARRCQNENGTTLYIDITAVRGTRTNLPVLLPCGTYLRVAK